MNLAAYCLQIAVVAAAGAVLPAVVRLRAPKPLLIYWQSLLAISLLSPFFLPWRQATSGLVDLSWGAVSVSQQAAGTAAPLSLARILFAVIVIGAAARIVWLGIGYARLAHFRRSATRIRPLPAVLETLTSRLHVWAEFYVSSDVQGPVSFSLYPAVILLPEPWPDMDEGSQRVIACHELLHVRRRDWLFHMAEELVRSAFWFHPAVWWVVERIRLVREQVVDQEVVRLTQARDVYIEALLKTADVNGMTLAAPCFSQRRHLKRRVETIVKEISMSRFRTAVSMAAVAICLVGVTRFAAWSFPLQSENKSAGKVYKISDGVTPPKLVYRVEPEYTPEAKDAKIEGTVKLVVEITGEGLAQNIDVLQSLDPGLDRSAVAAVEQWRFKPGTKDGQPVTVAATIEINFRLK